MRMSPQISSPRRASLDRFAGVSLMIALALAAPACAKTSSQGGSIDVAPRIEFPSDASLVEIANRSAPDLKTVATPQTATVDVWKLVGPLPDPGMAASIPADDSLSQILAAATQGRFSQAMACYARQMGSFMVEHDLPPSAELRTFMQARCGVLASAASESWSTIPLESDELPPPELVGASLSGAFKGMPSGVDSGAWYGRRGNELLWVTVVGRPEVEIIEYTIHRGDSPMLAVRGRSLVPLEWVNGRTTIGDYEVGDCRQDPRLPTAPPEFALVCPISLKDEYALVEVAGGEPGRVLGRRLYLNMAVLTAPADTFRSRLTIDGVTPTDSLVEMLNALRARMSLAPLRESAAQSQAIGDLLPHYFAAAKADDSTLIDKIALGLMAGWHVDGMKSGASFHGFRAAASMPLSQLLADLMALPHYRAALLSPEADVLALSTWSAGGEWDRLGLLATYNLYAPRDFGPQAARFLSELDRQRVAGGKPAVTRVDGDGPNKIIDDALESVARGDRSPDDALHDALSAFSQKTGRSFYGIMYRASVLEGWRPDFEPTILDASGVEAAVRVGFFVPKDGAWGEFLVFLIYAVK